MIVTPFEVSWERLRDAILHAPIGRALDEIDRFASIYRPAALRRKVRQTRLEQRCGLSPDIWIDTLEADSPDVAAYEVGRVRWELDDFDGAIEAFARAKALPEGEWAYADALLWAGREDEARSALAQIAAGSSEYRSFARVLLHHELSQEGAASRSDYELAEALAEPVFGDGPSRRNFVAALEDFRARSKGDPPDLV